jgi:hypothetical protein
VAARRARSRPSQASRLGSTEPGSLRSTTSTTVELATWGRGGQGRRGAVRVGWGGGLSMAVCMWVAVVMLKYGYGACADLCECCCC